MHWTQIGRATITLGGLLVLVGLGMLLLGRLPFLGRLPGDVTIRRGNFSCYAPIVSSLLLSLLLTVVLNLLLRVLHR